MSVPRETLARRIAAARKGAATRKRLAKARAAGICRGCGCTDNNACMTPSGPCYWAAPDLCSKCAAEGRHAA